MRALDQSGTAKGNSVDPGAAFAKIEDTALLAKLRPASTFGVCATNLRIRASALVEFQGIGFPSGRLYWPCSVHERFPPL